MTKRKRTNGQVQTIQWQKEKGQTDKYRQYNDKKKKDKRTSTENAMTERKRTNGQVQTIQWQKEKGQTDKYRQYNDKKISTSI
jgi:hypothetical protein